MKSKVLILGVALAAFSLQSMAQCGGDATMAAEDKKPKKDIVEVAASSDDFSTLVTAVQKAGLVKTLQGEGPFTVFAPTNESFAKLPAGTIDNLLMPENKTTLEKILTYHVIPGEFNAEAVIKAINDNGGKYRIVSAAGQQLTAKLENGKVVIEDTNGNKSVVTTPDVKASNGVIHVIDNVILPQ